MGDPDHLSIISQQGANSIVDATINPRQTCPSHYSQLPPLTMTSFLHCLNLKAFLNVHQLSLVVHVHHLPTKDLLDFVINNLVM
jgi:hypothetical protein